MTRRSFASLPLLSNLDVRKIVGIGVEDCIPQDLVCDWPEPVFCHGDFEVHWTGWKASITSHHICGQWLAWKRGVDCHSKKGQQLFYVNVPGKGQGKYLRGDEFYIGGYSLDDLGAMSTKNGRLRLLEEGRKRMIALLDGDR